MRLFIYWVVVVPLATVGVTAEALESVARETKDSCRAAVDSLATWARR